MLHDLGFHRNPVGQVQRTTHLPLPLALLALVGIDLSASFRPTIVADRIAQGQHRVDVGSCPVHAGPFQSCLHCDLVRALHCPTSDRPTMGLVGRILHLCFPFL